MASPHDRYGSDVLRPGWQQPKKAVSADLTVESGLVVEDVTTGFCGAIMRWENGIVVLEDRRGKRRSFPIGPGFWFEGEPVILKTPLKKAQHAATRTASGSVNTPLARVRVALPSRIYVEGRHDAELVEKVWGDDLRHSGVVVEFLGGIDDLPAIVSEFRPEKGRRLGVLVDHLVAGSKESRIAADVARGDGGEFVFVTGHPFLDVWEAVKPARINREAWPVVPRGTDWKHGVCDALGWPHESQKDIAHAWQAILGRVRSWTDLETPLLTSVEELIDFVTQDHVEHD